MLFFLAASVYLCTQSASGHGDLHERILELTKKIANEPTNVQLVLQRGELSRQHGDWQAAVSDCDRAKDIDPAADTDFLRGRAFLEGGKAAEALPLIQAILRREPENLLALMLRGRAQFKLTQYQEAAADFRETLKRTPNPEPDMLQETADALVASGARKEAGEMLATAITRIGPVPSLVQRALDLEIALKNFDAALTRVDAMQNSAPRPEPWMARRASVLAQAGRIPESKAAWEALIAHLNALPNLERGSHAMSKLMEDAKLALTALNQSNPAR